MQVTQKKSLLTDKELRKKISKEIVQKLNMVLDNKISNEEIDAFLDDEKITQNFKRCREWVKKEDEKTQIIQKLKDSTGKKITESYNRYAYVLMDEANTEEANKDNEKYFDYMTDKNKSLQMADYIGKLLFNADYTKYLVNNLQEGVDVYFENPEFIQVAHESSRVFKEQDASIHPDLIKLYNHNISTFETVSLPLFCKNLMANPMSLFLPYKEYTAEEQEKLITAGPLFASVLKKYENEVEELNNPNNKAYITSATMKYTTDVMNLNIFFKEYKPLNKLKEEGIFTKDFQTTKVFTNDGLPVTLKNAMVLIGEGKKIEVMEISDKDKARFTKALNENIAFDQEATNQEFDTMFNLLKENYEALDATKGFFTRDSKVFKDLNKELKPIVKEYNKCLKEINKEVSKADRRDLKFKLLGKLYKKSQNSIDKIKQLSIDYSMYKKDQEANGKVLNERSKNRISIADRLHDSLASNKLNLKFNKMEELKEDKLCRKNIEVDEVKLDNIDKNINLSNEININKNKTKIKTICFEK